MAASPTKNKRPAPVTVAISMGDPSGIGAEVVAGALASRGMRRAVRPVIFGDDAVFARACRRLGVGDTLPRVEPGEPVPAAGALVCCSRLPAAARKPGSPVQAGAEAQARYLELAIQAVRESAHLPPGGARGTRSAAARRAAASRGDGAWALCTAPISKAALHAAGLPFPGHTELLAARFGVERVVMMLAGPVLRVALATTHLPLAEVSGCLSPAGIAEVLGITWRALRGGFGIRRPRIAVCGLNPHAGEGGLFGDEEARLIAPGIELARKSGVLAEGPFPADGLFPRAVRGGWDAVLAMYHDQGLIPLKTVHFTTAVNVTLGLPIVRTSPDHGVAYDIAGKGRADPSSMVHALHLAARMAGR